MWAPHPSEVIRLYDSGSGDMGDVTDEGSRARWSVDEIIDARREVDPKAGGLGDPLAVPRVVFLGLLVKFSGGTGSADLTIRVDHHRGEEFDHKLFTLKRLGADGADGFLRVRAEELYDWIFDRGDWLVIEWSNPDAGITRWALEVRFADASSRS